MEHPQLTRRKFLIGSSLAGTGLLVGCQLTQDEPVVPLAKSAGVTSSAEPLSAWIHIAEDNQITLLNPSVEMGQGANTANPMLICEELDADWKRISVKTVGIDARFNHPGGPLPRQVTGGSTSVRDWSPILRQMGASARLLMRQAAAKTWNVPVTECTTKNATVTNSAGQQISYGQLVAVAASLPLPNEEEVVLKTPAEYRLLGKPIKRLDTPSKTDGSALFGIDVRLPDMLYATVAKSPVFAGELASMDKDAALSVKGVKDVVEIPNGVAVVAESYWQAKKGLQVLKPTFKGGNESFSTSRLKQQFAQDLDEIAPKARKLKQSEILIEADYSVPFMAHSTMEPMNCTVHWQDDSCDIWIGTQSQTGVGQTAKQITGLPPEKIRLNVTLLGGGFGRRGEVDMLEQALYIAKNIEQPVQLIWSREEDTQQDFYRPASATRFQVVLDGDGNIQRWQQQIVSPAILERKWKEWNPYGLGWIPYRFVANSLTLDGTQVPYQSEDNVDVSFKQRQTPVPVGFWRSVGDSFNGFFAESMMDEAAFAAKADPYEFRRKHLQGKPKELNVLELVTQKANWGNAPAGQFQGIAIHNSFKSTVAYVINVSLQQQKVKIERVVAAVDCGFAVNPNIVAAQIEGSAVWALSSALDGEISIEDGKVVQSNFHDVPIARLKSVPPIDVHIVESNKPSTGVGEPGVPPFASALANAIFAATGKRMRDMPFKEVDFV